MHQRNTISKKSLPQRINENVNNPRQFWKNIKEVIPKNGSKITSSVPFIKDYSASDNDESQQKSKADIFCTLFSSVANNLKRKTIKLCNLTWKKLKSNPIRTTSKFNFRLVNKIWVENQLRLLKRSKATVPDNLPPEMLKDCSNELSGPLCYLINLTVINGTIPNEWKLAKVIPIFKYGDRTDPNNYRQISILPILSKILASCAQSITRPSRKIPSSNKLSVWLSQEQIHRACLNIITGRHPKECRLWRIIDFIDLSKAFDTIGHEILLSKLPSYGIRNTELTWFTDYLFSRKQLVNFGKCSSEKESVLC